jgi:hypothetical protein
LSWACGLVAEFLPSIIHESLGWISSTGGGEEGKVHLL